MDAPAAPFRVLLPDEEGTLWRALRTGPAYLEPLARLALLTGMRENELLTLRKEDVSLTRALLFVRFPKWRKDPRKTEGLPLGDAALELLRSIVLRAVGELLFTDKRGRALSVVNTGLQPRRKLLRGARMRRCNSRRGRGRAP